MDVADILIRLFLGVVIGFCVGLTGIGGGVLVIPSLTLILGLPSYVSVGTASLYAFITRIVASWHHLKLQTIHFKLSLFLLAGALPANVLVALLVTKLASNDTSGGGFQNSLRLFMAAVVLFSAAVIIIKLASSYRKGAQHGKGRIARALDRNPVRRNTVAVILGCAVGALMGATSIGGGVIIVPMLMMIFGLSFSSTVGTSIFVTVLLALSTSLVYGGGSQLDIPTAVIMAGGALAGVPGGTRLSVKAPERPLQWVLVGFILTAAVMMLIK